MPQNLFLCIGVWSYVSNHLCHQAVQILQGCQVNQVRHRHPERSHQNLKIPGTWLAECLKCVSLTLGPEMPGNPMIPGSPFGPEKPGPPGRPEYPGCPGSPLACSGDPGRPGRPWRPGRPGKPLSPETRCQFRKMTQKCPNNFSDAEFDMFKQRMYYTSII